MPHQRASMEDVFGGNRINGPHRLHLVPKILQQRHCAIPSDSDEANDAAYTSASALFLAMIFCLRVYAFNM